jgi:hypothetical protein
MATGVNTRPAFGELAQRVDGGIEVTLLWSARGDRVVVTVSDSRSDEWFVLDAESGTALDAFYHPYAHAGSRVAALEPTRRAA